jgi:hypothetical protein
MIWKRWGDWKAHLYKGDLPICPYPTRNYRRGVFMGENPGQLVVLSGNDLSPHGVPYAQVCSYCLNQFNAREGLPRSAARARSCQTG